MKVLLDCRMATWSGVGRYTRGLVSGLAADSDLELVRVVADDAPVFPVATRTITAVSGAFSVMGMFELASIIREESPDLVHCLHFPTPVRTCAPLVVTLHDLTPLVMPEVMPSAARRRAYKALNSRAVRMAERILAPSEATARDLGKLFPTSDGKIIVTPLAADDFSNGPIAEDAGIHGPYLLSMGNTRPNKDLPTLLDAFAVVASVRRDLRLVLVGEEPAGYLASRLSPDMSGRVMFTGRVTDDRLRALYVGTSAFVFPSVYEGFGLPPLEAMALGTPVIAAAAASLPEVVGDAALLVPPGDPRALAASLGQMLDDGSLRASLAEKGRARAAGFSWRETARQTAAVYRSAITGRD